MSESHATIIVQAGAAANIRKFSQMTGKVDLDNMFLTALSATGQPPVTYYVSSGAVPDSYLDMLSTPDKLYTRAKAVWEADGLEFPFTLAQVTTALSKVTVGYGTFNGEPEGPHAMLARLGLAIIQGAT